MGIGGFFKGLGKGLLKAAPFAAYAIPGVGPIAGSLIQAGLGAANAGGGWKDALIGAGMGAGTSALGGKIPGLDKLGKGLAPSAGGGFKNILGNVGKGMARGALDIPMYAGGNIRIGDGDGEDTSYIRGDVNKTAGGIGTNRFRDFFKKYGPAIGAGVGGYALGRAGNKDQSTQGRRRRGGLGPDGAIPRMDQTSPNLAYPLLYGRNEALGIPNKMPSYVSW